MSTTPEQPALVEYIAQVMYEAERPATPTDDVWLSWTATDSFTRILWRDRARTASSALARFHVEHDEEPGYYSVATDHICPVCKLPFTQAEWDDRHDTDAGPLGLPALGQVSVHPTCCPECVDTGMERSEINERSTGNAPSAVLSDRPADGWPVSIGNEGDPYRMNEPGGVS